jgi:cyclopropane fatty-acyl-phospholipid synthase-like methyltransferase
LARLPPNPDVLELGCGQAVEPTRLLAERGRLLGIDISAEQVRRAQEACPAGDFSVEDMTTVNYEAGSFDGVVSLYAFNHIPRVDLPPLLERIAGWLRPGGYLLATFGCSGAEGVENDWLGVPMFFASNTPPENRAFVERAGLRVERDEVVSIVEPEPDPGVARFQWIMARKA